MNFRIAWPWPTAALALTLLAAALSWPASFGLSSRADLGDLTRGGGLAWNAELPAGIGKPRARVFLFPDYPVIYEDGRPLPRPGVLAREVERGGWGRYRVSGQSVMLSTSDTLPPTGRHYTIGASRFSLPEGLLLALWAICAAAWIGAARALGFSRLAPDSGGCRDNGSLALAAIISIGLALSLTLSPTSFSDGFFVGLAGPVAWALALGLLAASGRRAALPLLFLLALVPADAAWIRYAINASSDGSFVVAGVIPWGDANMHFLQAADIAFRGVTHFGFNGRFLYPAYFGGFLWMTGGNIQMANLFVASIALLSLAAACLALRGRIGAGGIALFAFGCWMFFRVHGCGLVMTEGLGLTCGLLALACILSARVSRSLPMLLLGVFMLALGSSARPGALFVLPLLGFYAGYAAWIWGPGTRSRLRSISRALGVVALAAALVVSAFAANGAIMRTLYRGEAKSFSNFAFSLHGLLTGTKWSVSYEAAHGDSAAVMGQNLQMLRESPSRLASGVSRAYGELFGKAFLYRFGPEKRLAPTLLALAGLGLVACWLLPPLREDAPWIWAAALGIFLSVPFAPPWDAEVRPYAATVAIQSLLPALGLALIAHWLRLAIGFRPPIGDSPCPLFSSGLIAACVALIALVIPLPLARAVVARNTTPAVSPFPLDFHAGSTLRIGSSGGVGEGAYRERLSDFAAGRGPDADVFTLLGAGSVLAINWNDLRAYAIGPDRSAPTTFLEIGGLRVDSKLAHRP